MVDKADHFPFRASKSTLILRDSKNWLLPRVVPFRHRVYVLQEGRWLLQRCNDGRLWLTDEQKLIDSHPLLLSKIWPKNSPTNQQILDWKSEDCIHPLGSRNLWETWVIRVAWSLGFYCVCRWFHRGGSWLSWKRITSEEGNECLGIVNHLFHIYRLAGETPPPISGLSTHPSPRSIRPFASSSEKKSRRYRATGLKIFCRWWSRNRMRVVR